jgi:hypothetical protein
MCLLPSKKTGKIPVQLFETKIAHGETSTAYTLNQIRCPLFTRIQATWQGISYKTRKLETKSAF